MDVRIAEGESRESVWFLSDMEKLEYAGGDETLATLTQTYCPLDQRAIPSLRSFAPSRS